MIEDSAEACVTVGFSRCIYAGDLAWTIDRLPKIAGLVSKQRGIAKAFSCGLKPERTMICSEEPAVIWNRLQFPIMFQSQRQRDFMSDFLLQRGVDSVKYLDEVVSTAAEVFGYDNDCPISERLSKQVLVIPNQYSLRDRDVRRIIDVVNTAWAELAENEFSTMPAASNPQPSLIPISKCY